MAPATSAPVERKRKAANASSVQHSETATKPSEKKPKVLKAEESVVPSSKPTVPSKPVVEESFPRGGASTLTPLEYREVSDQAKQDVLFEQTEVEEKPKPKTKRRRAEDDGAKDGAKKVRTDETTYAEALSFKRLNIGMTMIGCIKEINDLDMAISLPDQLTGFVSITEISAFITAQVEKAAGDEEDSDEEEAGIPDLREFFSIGQVVSCAVSALEHDAAPTAGEEAGKATSGRKRVALSLKPEAVNANLSAGELVEGLLVTASVTSEEDHGYVLSLGIDGLSGFLLKKNAKSYITEQNGGRPLKVGQLVYGGILKLDEARRIVSVTLEPEFIRKTVVPSAHAIGFDALKAGAFVNVKVKTILDNGLLLSFLGILEGTANLFNVGTNISNPEEDLKSLFKVGQKLRARVLFVDPIRKKVGFTLAPTLLQWTSYEFPAPSIVTIGTIVPDFTVSRIDAKLGLIVEHPEVGPAFVHVSRLSDKRVEKVEQKFKVGSKHRGRVVGFDYCGGLLQVTFQKSVLEQPFVRHDEIKVGMTVKGKIVKLTPGGVIISLSGSINGFCPKIHYADVALTQPEKMFKEGALIKCQVLSVDAKNKRVILTHKKSLLNSTLPKIISYSDVKAGALAHGVVTGVKTFGCLVTFYNEVRALVPMAELSDSFVKNAEDVVTVGQTVKCRILDVNAEEEKMRASFKLIGKSAQSPADLEAVSVGQVVSGSVVGILSDGILVELKPSMVRGYLPKTHLTENPVAAPKLLSGLREGTILKEVLIFGKDTRKGHLMLSMKGSIIQEMKRRKAVLTFDQFEEGMAVPGYVRNVTEKSCFVGFPGDVVGMAKLHNISDRYVTKVSDFLQIGQTVLAMIVKVDKEDRRIEVSLKHSICAASPTAAIFETDLLRSIFYEQDLSNFVALPIEKAKTARAWASAFKLGDMIDGTVKKSMPYGVIVELQDGVSGLITNTPNGGVLAVGTSVKGKIVDVNAERKIVDMVVLQSTVTDSKPNVDAQLIKEAKRSHDKETIVEAVVHVIKEDYGIITIPKLHNAVAYTVAQNFNSSGTPFTKFRVGQQLKVKVTAVPFLESAKAFEGFSRQRMLVVPLLDSDQPQDVLDTKRTIKAAVDSNFKSVEDLMLGSRIKAKIVSIKDTQLNMEIGSNLKGRVHATQIVDRIADLKDPKHPFAKYKIGQVIECKVLGFHDAKTFRSLPFTHRKSPAQTIVELTLKPSEMLLPDAELSAKAQEPESLETLTAGQECVGYVQSVENDNLWIHVGYSLLGRAQLLDCPNPAALRKPNKFYPPGSAVQCWVAVANPEKKTLDLTLRAPVDGTSTGSFQAGQILVGRIKKIEAGKGLVIQISPSMHGRVYLTDLSDAYEKDPITNYHVGNVVQCCVLSFDAEKHQLDLSLRDSRVKQTSAEVPNVEVKSIEDVVVDTVVSGYIRNVSDVGCFVGLSRNLSARVKISELSDAFIKQWKDAFQPGQLVQGRVVSVNSDQGRIEMSLKQSVVDPDVNGLQIKWDNIEKGQKVKGTVKAIKEYGVFIQLANSALTGLCHKSQLSDNAVNMIDKLYSVGDAVKAVVLKVDQKEKKLSLGLKASFFDENDYGEEDDSMDVDGPVSDQMDIGDADADNSAEEEEEEEEEEEQEADGSEGYDGDDADALEVGNEGDSEDEELDDKDVENIFQGFEGSDDEDEEEDAEPGDGLDVGGFDWDGAAAAENDEDAPDSDADGSDDDGKSSKKKSRRAKLRAKREEEERIAQKEISLLDGDQPPEVAEDFERLLMGSPNSSFLWIKFMAFQLQMAEVEKARQVAERALKSIGFREEQEKMNVWVALMNLENSYGTQETLTKVFERALAMNEPKAVYMQLIRIYERTEKWDQAEQLHMIATKKFNKSSKVWTSLGLFQLKRGKVEDARKTLQRSLQSLAKRKHVKTICKFAQMEFKYGEAERGRTIFEGIMANYPKRIDLWSVYLDMETRNGDVAITRRLFERVINHKFSSKKMKFFFKKFLDFEKAHGTPETIDHVKQAAVAYVEQLQN
ncbi:hypothetical protein PhCBS80983_g03584 [Powellomyces hirtus]|uniref:Protein RRP5 homolog n=1 Tax=Powellomyces hirtus TaxID=109895 RepID=A0A507E105_9FUNG|nr:hypothetical protein PhCBS80983_g03584 [Powellomyces hirtus]